MSEGEQWVIFIIPIAGMLAFILYFFVMDVLSEIKRLLAKHS